MSAKLTELVAAGVDISSAAQFHSHICVVTGGHRFQVFLDNVVGNGDYEIYMTKRKLGAGIIFYGPTTVMAVPSGVTAPLFPSITVDLTATDVVAIWIKGLALDVAVTGSVEIWVDDYSKAGNAMTLTDDAITSAKIADGAIGVTEAPLLANLDATISSRSTLTVANVLAGVFEGTSTIQDFFRLASSVLFGKSTGGGTANPKFRDLADTKNRVDAVTDVSGNRSSVTRDAT